MYSRKLRGRRSSHHYFIGLQFTKAVEAKQVAQQEAERARFVVMKADQVIRLKCSKDVLCSNLAHFKVA